MHANAQLPSGSLPLQPYRRAIVRYVENAGSLIAQTKMLLESLKFIAAPDTDLVIFGPQQALDQLPDHRILIKVKRERHPYAHDYGFLNSIFCLNGPGSEVLDNYAYLLRSDVDVFLTPAWLHFHPQRMMCGIGQYCHSDEVKQKCIRLAEKFNLTHRGWHNLGSTLYGPAQQVRAVCRLATMLCEYLIDTEFRQDPGAWPNWFRGVSSMYAGEIALNHLVPDLDGPSPLLDYFSASSESIHTYPHIHCWHSEEKYSKFAWDRGEYANCTEATLNIEVIHDYCLTMALRSTRSSNM